jgi:hypothetical protein
VIRSQGVQRQLADGAIADYRTHEFGDSVFIEKNAYAKL